MSCPSELADSGIQGASGDPGWALRRLIPPRDGVGLSRRQGEFPRGNGWGGPWVVWLVVHPRASSAGVPLADKRSVTPGRRTRRTPDGDRGGESEETAGARPRRQGARGAGRSGRRRYRSPGNRPPPLRKRLVTALRALSEAIHQDVAQACEQREHSPLTWEQRSGLGELWGPLCAALQTVYTMAHQAAYVFPPESWLMPGPQPSPGGLPRGAEDKPGAAGRV